MFPSCTESSAKVVYEALAYGLPCIVTPESGSIVRNNREGLVVKSQSTDELKKAILEVDIIFSKKRGPKDE